MASQRAERSPDSKAEAKSPSSPKSKQAETKVPIPAEEPSTAEANQDQSTDGDVLAKEPDDGAWAFPRKIMKDYDEELVKDWNNEIDALLTITALFSAVVAAFVVEFYRLLIPDPADTTVTLLHLLLLQANASVTQSIPESFHDRAQAHHSATALNGLWFTSLALALFVALFGLIVKQWLREFLHSSTGNLRTQVRIRQVKYDGLMDWWVPQIISTLSMVLQSAVILFLVGLIMLLFHLNHGRVLPVTFTVICGILLGAFTLCAVLPAVSQSCPYRSPLALIFLRVCYTLWNFYTLPTLIKKLKQTWIDRETEKLQQCRRETRLWIDRRALDWTHRNNRKPTAVGEPDPILTCMRAVDPAAVLDWLGRELNCSAGEVIDNVRKCTFLSNPNVQHFISDETATMVLRIIFEVLQRFDGFLAEELSFPTLDNKSRPPLTKAAMLSISASLMEGMASVPEDIMVTYVDTVWSMIEHIRTSSKSYSDASDAFRDMQCLSYCLDVMMTQRSVVSHRLLDKLLDWAIFCYSEPAGSRTPEYASECLVTPLFSHVRKLWGRFPFLVSGSHGMQSDHGADTAGHQALAFEEAAAAYFRALPNAIYLDRDAAPSEEQTGLLNKVFTHLASHNYPAARRLSWSLCFAIITTTGAAQHALPGCPPSTASSMILGHILAAWNDTKLQLSPAEVKIVLLWVKSYAKHLKLGEFATQAASSSSQMVPQYDDLDEPNDTFRLAVSALVLAFYISDVEKYQTATARENAKNLVSLLRMRLELARRDTKFPQETAEHVEHYCVSLTRALKKATWLDADRFAWTASIVVTLVGREEQPLLTELEKPRARNGPFITITNPQTSDGRADLETAYCVADDEDEMDVVSAAGNKIKDTRDVGVGPTDSDEDTGPLPTHDHEMENETGPYEPGADTSSHPSDATGEIQAISIVTTGMPPTTSADDQQVRDALAVPDGSNAGASSELVHVKASSTDEEPAGASPVPSEQRGNMSASPRRDESEVSVTEEILTGEDHDGASHSATGGITRTNRGAHTDGEASAPSLAGPPDDETAGGAPEQPMSVDASGGGPTTHTDTALVGTPDGGEHDGGGTIPREHE